MVSGRSEKQVECVRCCKLWIELDLADRKKRICVSCLAQDEPVQMSLLPKLKPKEKLRKQCERREPAIKLEIEQLALIPVKQKKEIPPPRLIAKDDYRHLVFCEKCRRQLDPCAEPWVGAECVNCWPDDPTIKQELYKEWKRYNPKSPYKLINVPSATDAAE